ncbi:hypothetical protein AVEN_187939-1 [Araneus ventricosus]|uniref:Uncharacterized protein n=1 Tax=Araneus ventricosus TaxID=182803 RepID=A0A4Y2E0T0_ARAVE|nr:hypothetical protein AVEN_187939-1 [Araneus ventricosus]
MVTLKLRLIYPHLVYSGAALWLPFRPGKCRHAGSNPGQDELEVSSESESASYKYVKEEYQEWMSKDEDIPVAATPTDLEISQVVCEQDQALKVGDSDGEECVEGNSPTNAEMRQALDILKGGVQLC